MVCVVWVGVVCTCVYLHQSTVRLIYPHYQTTKKPNKLNPPKKLREDVRREEAKDRALRAELTEVRCVDCFQCLCFVLVCLGVRLGRWLLERVCGGARPPPTAATTTNYPTTTNNSPEHKHTFYHSLSFPL